MKNKFNYYIITWAIFLAVFNAVVFMTPSSMAGMSKFGGAFWAGYIFITLAFIGQLVCAYFAFRAEYNKKLFLNLPLITISYAALVVSLILGAACMAVPNLPNWVGAVVCVLILGFNAAAVVKAKAAAEIIGEVGDRVSAQTTFIKPLTAKAESLMAKAQTPEAKSAAKKVYEAVRYSDPVSSPDLAEMEAEISARFDKFAKAITDGNGNAERLAGEITTLLNDRNKMCKVLK